MFAVCRQWRTRTPMKYYVRVTFSLSFLRDFFSGFSVSALQVEPEVEDNMHEGWDGAFFLHSIMCLLVVSLLTNSI